MFPEFFNCKEIQCGKTKSSAIINVLVSEKSNNIISLLKSVPFALGIDGCNDMVS